MDAYNQTPVWQMYNLPTASSGGQAISDGGMANSTIPNRPDDKVGGAIKQGLAQGTMNDLNSGLGLGMTSSGAGGGILKSIGSSLMAAFGL